MCYRVAKSRIPETSALTNVPCGICPVSMPFEWPNAVSCVYINVIIIHNLVTYIESKCLCSICRSCTSVHLVVSSLQRHVSTSMTGFHSKSAFDRASLSGALHVDNFALWAMSSVPICIDS